MAEPEETSGNTDERTVIDAAADLLQTAVDWLRQEAEALVKDKVVFPLQRLGFTLFFALAAASVLVMGILFISIGSLLLLAEWLTWPGALYAIGGTLVLGAAIFSWFKMRMMQK